MLKFGQNELNWADVVAVIISNEDTNEVSVVTVDDQSLVVGSFPFASDAATIKNMIDNGKLADSIGGVTIVIDIDDF